MEPTKPKLPSEAVQLYNLFIHDHRTGVLPEHLPFTPPGKSRQSHHFVNISAAVLIKSLNWRGVRILENRLMPPEAWSCRDSNLFFASSE